MPGTPSRVVAAKRGTDFVRLHFGSISQVLRPLRGGIRHIGNQMYHRWLCDEGFFEFLDPVDQVDRPPAGNRIGSLGG